MPSRISATTISFLFAAAHLGAQDRVGVSSLTVEPTNLNCRGHAGSVTVAAQVYFSGIGGADSKSTIVKLGLSVYSSLPANNRVRIGDETKEVEVRVSPGSAEFEVFCSADTHNGELNLIATTLSAPTGVKIDSDRLVLANLKTIASSSAAQKSKTKYLAQRRAVRALGKTQPKPS